MHHVCLYVLHVTALTVCMTISEKNVQFCSGMVSVAVVLDMTVDDLLPFWHHLCDWGKVKNSRGL